MNILTCLCCPVPDHVKTGIGYISLFAIIDAESLIAVLHIEVVTTRPYVTSKISYFNAHTFDVKHHATHGTILINFGSENRSYIFQFPGASGGAFLSPPPPPPLGIALDPLIKKCAPLK
jgi:hypothetical protein